MRPPRRIEGDTGRVFDHLYEELTKLQKAINQPAAKGGTATDTQGKSGDIRVVKGDVDDYHLEMKTGDGWVRTKQEVFSKVTKANT
jgi:hypothetical protein